MDETLIIKITEYTLKLADQTITPGEFDELNSILSVSPKGARHYNFLMMAIGNFQESGKEIVCDELSMDSILNEAVWKELADYENTAQEIKPDQGNSRQELIQKVVYPPREKRKISRFGILTLLNTAAVILLFLFLRFSLPDGGIEVATLTDSVHAKWADDTFLIKPGMRMTTGNDRLLLREGYAALLFDNQTRVTLEGPAEFQILADDRISLNYGKVYLSVPREAIGFSVYTSSTKIIDMGTEFGVQSDINGTTQLHVIKGKTVLMAGAADKIHLEVSAGIAKKVSGVSGEISDIRCQTDYFVRTIHSESNCIWRGQDKINLADIVGGGNGFGNETLDRAIDPISGNATLDGQYGKHLSARNDYRPSAVSPYIDGTFVPNGQTPQVVSSQGHLFGACPVTNGSYSQNIRAFTNLDWMVLEDISDPQAQKPFLYLHANMGITFDLKSIRRALPGVTIGRFQSHCGIRKYALRPSVSNADFWVLVDGTVRFKQQQVKTGGLYPIDIELSENDRFLTLVETDGGDPDDRIVEDIVLTAIDSDWGVFVDPVLTLESKQRE